MSATDGRPAVTTEKRLSESQHEYLVRNMAELLFAGPYRDVRVDLPGYDMPDKVFREGAAVYMLPDLTARGTKFFVFEVETADSIDDEHTLEQWPMFAAHAQRMKGEFWVVVPRRCGGIAMGRLKELGLKGQVVEL